MRVKITWIHATIAATDLFVFAMWGVLLGAKIFFWRRRGRRKNLCGTFKEMAALAAYPCALDPASCRDLRHKGFARLPGFVDRDMWRQCIRLEDGAVEHAGCQWPLVRRALGRLGALAGWEDPALSKYRVSAGTTLRTSNATDAAALHRDIMVYDEKGDVPAIFTMIVYLDAADLRVVPGSHRQLHMGWPAALTVMRRATTLHFEPGDALLFHATLLHGGVFPAAAAPGTPRRIIQMFDIYPHRRAAGQPHDSDRVLHVWSPKDEEDTSVLVSRLFHTPALAPVLVWAGTVSCAAGYGHRQRFRPPAPYTIISGEAQRSRSQHDQAGWQDGNTYAVARHGCAVHDADAPTNARLRRFLYGDMQRRTLGAYVGLPLLALVLVVVAIAVAARARARAR